MAADQANYGGANECLIWETFARRGIGFSATEAGGEEFDVNDFCAQSFSVEKSVQGQAVAGSVLTYELSIINTRTQSIPNASLTDQLPDGVTFVEGSSNCDLVENNGVLNLNLGEFNAEETITCTYQVELPADEFSTLELKDGAENGSDNWDFITQTGGSSADWRLTDENSISGQFSFFAPNTITISDQLMQLAEPVVLDGPSPGLAFWHLYDLEEGADGAVVEISTDGENWIDLGEDIIVNPYTGHWHQMVIAQLMADQLSTEIVVVGFKRLLIFPIIQRFRFGCVSDLPASCLVQRMVGM